MLFQTSGSATADAAGTATVYLNGPHRVGTTLQIGQAVITATRAATVGVTCRCDFYRGGINPAALLGTSVVADADTMRGLPGDQLAPGDQLVAVFTGCQPGTLCTVNLRGEELPWTL